MGLNISLSISWGLNDLLGDNEINAFYNQESPEEPGTNDTQTDHELLLNWFMTECM